MPSTDPPPGNSYFKDANDLIGLEKQQLEASRERLNIPRDRFWSGIALSGGGIRSAIVGLGAFQALAANGLLRHFDYISSVSGGGYIASSLQWWWSDERIREEQKGGEAADPTGTEQTDFPYGTLNPNPKLREMVGDASINDGFESKIQGHRLSFLRNHGSYLTPGDGITIYSAVSVVFRNLFLNLLVWIPLATLAFIVIIKLSQPFEEGRTSTFIDPALAGIVRSTLLDPLPEAIIPGKWHKTEYCGKLEGEALQNSCGTLRLSPVFAILIWIAYLVIGFFALMSILLALLSRSPYDIQNEPAAFSKATVTQLAVCALCAGAVVYLACFARASDDFTQWDMLVLITTPAFAFCVLLLRMLFETRRKAALNTAYVMRRTYERWSDAVFVATLLILAIGLVPVIPFQLWTHAPKGSAGGAGVLALVSGVATGLYGHYTRLRNAAPGLAAQVFAALGAALFMYGLLVTSYVLAMVAISPSGYLIDGNYDNFATATIMGSVLLSLAISIVANVNNISLHRFYRDRLMEAFLPSESAVARRRTTSSAIADRLLLTVLAAARPYPLINTNVILVNDDDQKVSSRGGDNFVLSPLFVGSNATGWQSTEVHIAAHGPITLASAMATSGAAANANSGYVGSGLTRDRLVSLLMIILNMRLGIWFANPNPVASLRARIPTYLHPVFSYGFLRDGYKRNSDFVELSDGGHFENLGLYELARRKLKLILVFDSEADKDSSFAGFVSAVRRIQEDFKARIYFDANNGPELLLAETPLGYPPNVKSSKSPYFVARIEYEDRTQGTILYIKAVMLKELSFLSRGYKAANADFPHQTTADQFFEPDQFEAYRELGYQSMTMAIGGLELRARIEDPDRIWTEFVDSGRQRELEARKQKDAK